MILIENQLCMSIKVNGKPLPATSPTDYVVLTEGNGALVPTAKIILNDIGNALDTEALLMDGSLVEITVSKTKEDANAKVRKYRIFSPKGKPSLSGGAVEIFMASACSGFYMSNKIDSYKGRSTDVVSQIAKACGLTYDGPQSFNGKNTNDDQLWINSCSSPAVFLREHVAKEAFMENGSAMVWALTSDWKLKYRNIVDVINSKLENIKYVICFNAPPSATDLQKKKVYMATEARDKSLAGLMNVYTNYGTVESTPQLDGTKKVIEETTVKVNGMLTINKEVKEEVVFARRKAGPIDCGNTHDKSEEARYQNLRIKALFTEKVSVMVTEVTEIELFDAVIFRQQDADLTKPTKNTDVYVCTGKTLVVEGQQHYAERIELIRMSVKMKDDAVQLPNANSASEKSLIPDVKIDTTAQAAKATMAAATTIQQDTAALKAASEATAAAAAASEAKAVESKSILKKAREQIAQWRKDINAGKEVALKSIQDSMKPVIATVNEYKKTLQPYTDRAKAAKELSKEVQTKYKEANEMKKTAMLVSKQGMLPLVGTMAIQTGLMGDMAGTTEDLTKGYGEVLGKINQTGDQGFQELKKVSDALGKAHITNKPLVVGSWNDCAAFKKIDSTNKQASGGFDAMSDFNRNLYNSGSGSGADQNMRNSVVNQFMTPRNGQQVKLTEENLEAGKPKNDYFANMEKQWERIKGKQNAN